jgi:hypothetical protein
MARPSVVLLAAWITLVVRRVLAPRHRTFTARRPWVTVARRLLLMVTLNRPTPEDMATKSTIALEKQYRYASKFKKFTHSFFQMNFPFNILLHHG